MLLTGFACAGRSIRPDARPSGRGPASGSAVRGSADPVTTRNETFRSCFRNICVLCPYLRIFQIYYAAPIDTLPGARAVAHPFEQSPEPLVIRTLPVDAAARRTAVELPEGRTRPRQQPIRDSLGAHRNDEHVAADTSREGLYVPGEIEPFDDFHQLRLGIRLAHPVAVSNDRSLEQ